MGVTFYRPDARLVIPGVLVMQTKAAAATPRWLVGGISAANCIAAYEAKGAASQAASYTNLANPGTFTATAPVAPTWNATDGWIFNGTSQYLLGPNVLNNSYSVIIKFNSLNISGSNKTLFGAYHDSGQDAAFLMRASDASNFGYFNGLTTSTIASPSATSGIQAIAGKSVYKNNNTVAATIPAGTFSTTLIMAFGAYYYRNTTPAAYGQFNLQAIYFYDKILSSGEIASQMATGIAAV